ncbi:MAG TPA: hypothetical protein V6C97_32230 [Oculatellaceae cyanobacterium]
MATHERRRKLTIEEVNVYWRALKEGHETPNLQRLCNAIRTLDLALSEPDSSLCSRLSVQAWKHERNDCFDFLIASFPGYFLVYAENSTTPLDSEGNWPERGSLEFYPSLVNRRDDACKANLSDIHESLVTRLRWCFAEGRQCTTPEDFAAFNEMVNQHENEEQAAEAKELLTRLFESCADEASKLKKIAHRKWWQLQAEEMSCKDRKQRHQLRKQMEQLELLWGPGAAHQFSTI